MTTTTNGAGAPMTTLPTTINIHPQGRIILHYRDAVKPLSDLPEEERLAVLRELAERYNHHDTLADLLT